MWVSRYATANELFQRLVGPLACVGGSIALVLGELALGIILLISGLAVLMADWRNGALRRDGTMRDDRAVTSEVDSRKVAKDFNTSQRLAGGILSFGAVLLLASGRAIAAIAVMLMAGVATVLLGRRAGGNMSVVSKQSQSALTQASASSRGTPWLALMVLGVWPALSNVFIVAIALASGKPFDELPVELVVPIIGIACAGAGLAAVRSGQPGSTHGWWALAGGVSALIYFGIFVSTITGVR
jgi:hypothetical protein